MKIPESELRYYFQNADRIVHLQSYFKGVKADKFGNEDQDSPLFFASPLETIYQTLDDCIMDPNFSDLDPSILGFVETRSRPRYYIGLTEEFLFDSALKAFLRSDTKLSKYVPYEVKLDPEEPLKLRFSIFFTDLYSFEEKQ